MDQSNEITKEESKADGIVERMEPLALKQFTELVVSGMPTSCLAGYLNCTEDELVEVLNHPTITKSVTQSRNVTQLQSVALNESWDSIERKAVKQISKALAFDDPEFALRAAHLANKALRRKAMEKAVSNDEPLNGGTIVLTLNNNIINQLQAPSQPLQQSLTVGTNVPKKLDVFQASSLNKLIGKNLAEISPAIKYGAVVPNEEEVIEIDWESANAE